jgi:DNA-binding transcriptional ArsR family regulator
MRANIKTTGAASNPSRAPQPSATCDIPCFKGKLVRELQREVSNDDAFEATRELFAALSDRTRLKILYALRNGDELCVCDVAHVLGMSISAASHHLRKLRDLRILGYRNDGKMAYYSIRDKAAAKIVAVEVGRFSR